MPPHFSTFELLTKSSPTGHELVNSIGVLKSSEYLKAKGIRSNLQSDRRRCERAFLNHLIESGLAERGEIKRVVMLKKAQKGKVRVEEYQDGDKLWEWDNQKRTVVDGRDFGVEFNDGSKKRFTVEWLKTAGDAAFHLHLNGEGNEIHERMIEQVARHVGIDVLDPDVRDLEKRRRSLPSQENHDSRVRWMLAVDETSPDYFVIRRPASSTPIQSGFTVNADPIFGKMNSLDLLKRARNEAEKFRLIPEFLRAERSKQESEPPKALGKPDVGNILKALEHKLDEGAKENLSSKLGELGHGWHLVEEGHDPEGHDLEFTGVPILAVRQYMQGKPVPELPEIRGVPDHWSPEEKWEYALQMEEETDKGHREIRPAVTSQIETALSRWENENGNTHHAEIESFRHSPFVHHYFLKVRIRKNPSV